MQGTAEAVLALVLANLRGYATKLADCGSNKAVFQACATLRSCSMLAMCGAHKPSWASRSAEAVEGLLLEAQGCRPWVNVFSEQ